MVAIDRALIVGAGLGGLAVALRLRALGVAVDLVERRAGAESHGAGILLTGNALRALHELGVAQAVLDHGRRVRRVRFTDDAGGELFEVDCEAHGWPAFVSLRRDALQRLLLRALVPLVPRWGTTVAELEQRADAVDVAFSDGTHGLYGLVVAADGVHSQLRQLLFGAPPAQAIAGFHGWRFVAPCPPGLEHPQYMLGNGRTLLLHPLPGGEVYCGAGPLAEAAAPHGGGELEQLRAAFADFGGPAAQVIARLDGAAELIPTRYFQVEQRPWHSGRCVLIGDAAHACAPTLAQGGAMAFEDAVVLGEALRDGSDLPAALDAFERRRAPRVAEVQSASLARMAVNRPADPRALAVRNALLRKIGAEQLLGAWSPLMERSP